ncbi:MAG: hypothetical protein ABSC72_03870 [Methylovirgula sp.]
MSQLPPAIMLRRWTCGFGRHFAVCCIMAFAWNGMVPFRTPGKKD